MEAQKKDTKLFVICGKARNGKDTTALMIKEIYESKGKKVLNLSYGSYIKEYAKKISNWNGSDETKPRELLQQLGTAVIRKNIDEMFFVKKIMEDIQVYSYFFDVLTISDARLKPEVTTPIEKFDNVYTIKITRPNFDNGLTEAQKNHITETDLDDYNDYDYQILNDGNLDDLNKKIENLVRDVENEH